MDLVDRLAGRDPAVLALLKAAKAGPGRGSAGRGRPSLGKSESDRPNDLDEEDAARLAREHPDLLAAVAAGERSLHSAAVEAGYRRRRVSVRVDDAVSAATTLRRALGTDVQRDLAVILRGAGVTWDRGEDGTYAPYVGIDRRRCVLVAGDVFPCRRYGAAVADRDLTDALLEVVRERMDAEGLSHGRMAAAAGLSQQTMSNQLRGVGVPTLDTMEAMALALHTTLEELLASARKRA